MVRKMRKYAAIRVRGVMPGMKKPHETMEETKKPRRPRISTGAASGPADSDQDSRYEKVNYSGTRPSSPRPYQSNNYGERNSYQGQGRQGGGYNSQQGNYSQRSQEGYGQRPHNNYGERPHNNYGQTRQGGYNQRPQGHYNPNGYNRNNYRQEGYANRSEQGSYNQEGYTPRGYSKPTGYGKPSGYQKPDGYNKPSGFQKPDGYNKQDGYNKPGGYNKPSGYNKPGGYQKPGGYNKPGGYQKPGGYNKPGGFQKPGGYGQQRPQQGGFRPQGQHAQGQGHNPKFTPKPKQIDYVLEDIDPNAEVRLNKYMANAGICSRREADEYIISGKVKVNGETVTELGTKISRNDVVEFDDKVVTPERKCYVLLNKPKDCVTTSDDPNGRTTVLDIVKNACEERIYPVGRLDRNTTGVLLLTNDGDLASKLTHPKFVKKKIYHVWTDKDITEEDMQRIADGLELEDGEIHADAISYVGDDRNQAGIEIHSGRNRIVRRIFEHLGYRVVKLDRVYFAGLTKKNLPRGRWRYLTQEEVNYLRMGAFE